MNASTTLLLPLLPILNSKGKVVFKRGVRHTSLPLFPRILRLVADMFLTTATLLAIFQFALPASAHAPGLAVAMTDAQILDVPEIGTPPTTTLLAGTTVVLTGDVAPGFVYVTFDGGSGWVNANLLSISGKPGIQTSLVTSRTLILDAPFPDAGKLGTLDPGEAVILTGAVVGEYAAASSDGVGGWVNRADLGPIPLE